MDRTACIELPAFPLQLLLQRNPAWRERPAAVVDSDRPQGKILWVNEHARARRVLPGMRYAAGLSLAGGLCAAEVPRTQIDRAVDELADRLRRFTPNVEPARNDPGAFWLDAEGLERLHPSLKDWAGQVRVDLKGSGFFSSLVVGYSRFGAYALAKSKRGVLVLSSPRDERVAARQVPLDRLALEPPVRDALYRLGVSTVGQFMDLPTEGVAKRFGDEVLRLHRLAAGVRRLPLQPERPELPATHRIDLDHAETEIPRLMPLVERLLHPLLAELADRGRVLVRLHLGLKFERLGHHVEKLTPAAPTLGATQLLELIRLRLEGVRRLPDGVEELALHADSLRATPEQLRLFAAKPRRDPAAAERSLARVRAELGDDAVVRARLREGHLPEARFYWEALERIVEAQPRELGDQLVRRIYARPLPLAPRARHEPDGWMLRGLKQGPVIRMLGPYVVSGGWWAAAGRTGVHREYHFAETQRGELLWIYYDRERRRWYMQGRVE